MTLQLNLLWSWLHWLASTQVILSLDSPQPASWSFVSLNKVWYSRDCKYTTQRSGSGEYPICEGHKFGWPRNQVKLKVADWWGQWPTAELTEELASPIKGGGWHSTPDNWRPPSKGICELHNHRQVLFHHCLSLFTSQRGREMELLGSSNELGILKFALWNSGKDGLL